MDQPATHMLDVPGARLYYEVQGSGPALALIGQPMGALAFATIEALLAEYYTVVTYDPRGFARSAIDDPDQDADPDLLADDVRRVLDAVGQGPAHIFGSSGGAVTGLALIARYPDHVRTLVAHEPPLALLLPEPEQARAGMHEIYDTYRTAGIGAAWERFSALTGMSMAPPDGGTELQPPSPEMVVTSERFFGHGLLPIALYEPNVSALKAAGQVVVAGGTTSKSEFPRRTAIALAERLGRPVVDFPGGHAGFVSDAKEFASVLRQTLVT